MSILDTLKYKKGNLIMVALLPALSVLLSSCADTQDKELMSSPYGACGVHSLSLPNDPRSDTQDKLLMRLPIGAGVYSLSLLNDPRFSDEFDKDTIAESIKTSSASGEDIRGRANRKVLISPELLDASLARMRRAINDGNRTASVFVVRQADPKKMFSKAVRQLSGPKVIIADSDPQYTIHSAEALSYDSTSSQPDYTIVGSISEFDKEKSLNDTVTLNLYLADSTTHAPVMHVSNTIHFIRDDQNHVIRFIIPGDGGEIQGKGDAFRAIRQLVQYSVLQLFGKFYHIPCNRFLHRNTTDSDTVSISSKK